ncbi:prostamide/prostaglandin F synthase isoform X2 [Rhipicephalus sanguineus]|uniref:prostamide/prostaglandin F synthase isoform X2 n=1 Tax=Rhipicephalus sanguineus TaxID=34632 RepID=UPI0018950A90|nr:prostamide/prostaglandin F synthase isoform X2 [Rhipicephalus sanguineus]
MAFAMRLSFPFIYRGLILFADVSKVPAEEEEMNAAQLIGKFTLKEVSSGKSVTVESLWRDQTCVLMFFRRWACPFCRLDAVRLSRIKPQLDAAGVRLVGIGHENIGLEDFRRGEYFKGELYVDEERNAYKALQYKRFSWFTIIPAILTSSARAKAAEVARKCSSTTTRIRPRALSATAPSWMPWAFHAEFTAQCGAMLLVLCYKQHCV